ncbi:MAG: hypothetical protein HZA91_19685 [Verrucomicrobia bacterium]|nr:hypothetical protein [Verrucomicrobiota bacterium]
MKQRRSLTMALALFVVAGPGFHAVAQTDAPLQISGIYPHLAAFNGVGEFVRHGECGIGAVVPWAGKLWFLTYPPHSTRGSNDKLYAVAINMSFEIRPESVGGTHASRMIHKESNQLIIGPYFIDAKGAVRACDVKNKLVGRMTAVMRHLTDPANRVYFFDMEGAIYEVNVHTLEVSKLFAKPVPGWHGKGGYTAQGRVVIANNGESAAGKEPKEYLAKLPPKRAEDAGALAEWDGKEWRIIERHQFTDVTGPGGIHGAPDNRAPLWAIGWDKRSVILKLLDGGKWSTFRVPKGSYSFDPTHGWFTEWPRIREVTGGKFLMVMHGQMFDFPRTFSRANTAGIRPVCTHLRYVPDFCDWNGRLVIASDDTSVMGNPLAGQAQSNLCFGDWDELKTWGPTAGWGGVWVGDSVKKDTPSDPFLFAGYARRALHVSHQAEEAVTFTVEADVKGHGKWHPIQKIEVPAKSYRHHVFDAGVKAEWVRLKAGKDCVASAYFHVSGGGAAPRGASADKSAGVTTPALIRPAKANRNLQVVTADGYYEVDEKLAFTVMAEPEEVKAIRPKLAVQPEFTVDAASVVIADKSGNRWRLPKTDAAFDRPFASGWPRGVREVESERNLANFHGIFYEIPRSSGAKSQDQPDYRKMKPVAAHRMRIADFCTWRGLMVMSGEFDAPSVGRVFKSADGKVALWFGKTDDLWQLGKPAGRGGPWKATAVKAGEPSDPFLMTNFARKSLTLSHDAKEPVTFTVEVDFLATGVWREYDRFTVEPGKPFTHDLPDGYGAHWVRLHADRDCTATAQFIYE